MKITKTKIKPTKQFIVCQLTVYQLETNLSTLQFKPSENRSELKKINSISQSKMEKKIFNNMFYINVSSMPQGTEEKLRENRTPLAGKCTDIYVHVCIHIRTHVHLFFCDENMPQLREK